MGPRGQRGISVEDLCHAIAAMKENDMELIAVATGSPFNLEVRSKTAGRVQTSGYQGV